MQTKTVCSYMGRVDERTDKNGTMPEIGPYSATPFAFGKSQNRVP